jgi:inner membrane protein
VATIVTHGVFGLGLGKLFTGRKMPWSFWTLAFVLPMVPDLDVLGLEYNIPYYSPFGHRGFSHSLLFALVLGYLTAGLTFRRFKTRFLDLGGFFFVVIASHGLLDALTNGGYGVAFFWPLDNTRYGLWGPIQVSDIGFEWPDFRHSRTVRTELLYVWLPTSVAVALAMLSRQLWRVLRKRNDDISEVMAPNLAPRNPVK